MGSALEVLGDLWIAQGLVKGVPASRDDVVTARLGELLKDIFVVPGEHFQGLETDAIFDLNCRAFGTCFGSIVDPLSKLSKRSTQSSLLFLSVTGYF